MQRSYLLLIFMLFHLNAFSQLHETFSDSNFTVNPAWEGETDFFSISSTLELESNGPNATSQIHLSTPNLRCRNTEWNFYARLDFDITTSNWAKIYLTSDRSNTENFPKGYYVKFDGSTNSVDLYRQDSTLHTKLIAGKSGRAGKTSKNIFRIKVICDPFGNWHLFSDSTATENHYIKEGTAMDTSFSSSAYCSVYFAHSASRRKLFYLDNFTVAPAPLSILEARSVSNSVVELIFNQPLNPLVANTPDNYTFSPSSFSILSASIDPQNNQKVRLQLSHPMNSTFIYSVTCQNLTDLSSNLIGPLNTISFQYRTNTQYGDVVITEIFPDPSPARGLPEVEFVELFNRTNDTIELQNFQLSDGSSKVIFPPFKIAPTQYLLVCASTSLSYFAHYSPKIGVANFPSLNNSGDHLTFKNQNGVLLHEVNYSDDWYRDNAKKEGGWSLEMIDTNTPCTGSDNWAASLDPTGGTPSLINSVAASKPDLSPPQLLNGYITDSIHVELIFNESPDTISLSSSNFTFDKNNKVQKIISSSETTLTLLMDTPFTKGELYTLFFTGVKDCNGNASPEINVALIMPSEATSEDIIINEVLFNPTSGGYDFVELYNRSSKYIDLKNWQLANIYESIVANQRQICSTPFILKPQEYIAFTENKSMLLNHYPLGKHESIIEISDLPSYNDDKGTVILLNVESELMDRFDYSEDFHFALLDDKEGVSLERISPAMPSDNPHNWQSASSQSGYATPGYRNSQNATLTDGSQVWVEPTIFTPDENGDKDFAMINYKFANSGNIVNITIFDPNGREMIRLAKNELLATEGFYRWDGNNTKNEKVRSGPYIIDFELFDLHGEVKKFKEVVVVGW